jgi:hypothetical protein
VGEEEDGDVEEDEDEDGDEDGLLDWIQQFVNLLNCLKKSVR